MKPNYPPRIAKSSRYITIDIIRGLSAIFIVLYHYTCRFIETTEMNVSFNEDNWPFRLSWGYGAISTFFILSGFLTSKLYFSNSNEKRFKISLKYLVNRFFRLYPTFWVCVTLTTMCLICSQSDLAINLKDFILNFTMIPKVFNVSYIDGAYWTMQMEFFFSLILGGSLLIRQIKTRTYVLYIWISACIIYNALGIVYGGLIWKLFRLIFMPSFASCFIAGLALFHMLQDFSTNKKFIGLLILTVVNQIISSSGLVNDMFFILTIILLSAYKQLDKVLVSSNPLIKILIFLASISYPLYLIHQMVGFTILRWLLNLGITSEILIIVPIAISIAIAFLIHRFVELPSSDYGKNVFRKITQRHRPISIVHKSKLQ